MKISSHLDKAKLKTIPIAEASQPKPGLYRVYVDSYWMITPDMEILLYDGSPQCNRNGHAATHLQRQLYPECSVVQLPLIFIRHDCEA